jgi:hypothetical protein
LIDNAAKNIMPEDETWAALETAAGQVAGDMKP